MSLFPSESRNFPDLVGQPHGYGKTGRPRPRSQATVKRVEKETPPPPTPHKSTASLKRPKPKLVSAEEPPRHIQPAQIIKQPEPPEKIAEQPAQPDLPVWEVLPSQNVPALETGESADALVEPAPPNPQTLSAPNLQPHEIAELLRAIFTPPQVQAEEPSPEMVQPTQEESPPQPALLFEESLPQPALPFEETPPQLAPPFEIIAPTSNPAESAWPAALPTVNVEPPQIIESNDAPVEMPEPIQAAPRLKVRPRDPVARANRPIENSPPIRKALRVPKQRSVAQMRAKIESQQEAMRAEMESRKETAPEEIPSQEANMTDEIPPQEEAVPAEIPSQDEMIARFGPPLRTPPRLFPRMPWRVTAEERPQFQPEPAPNLPAAAGKRMEFASERPPARARQMEFYPEPRPSWQRHRRLKLVRFLVCEAITIGLLIFFLKLGFSYRFAYDTLGLVLKILAIVAAVTSAIVPIIFYGLPDNPPPNER